MLTLCSLDLFGLLHNHSSPEMYIYVLFAIWLDFRSILPFISILSTLRSLHILLDSLFYIWTYTKFLSLFCGCLLLHIPYLSLFHILCDINIVIHCKTIQNKRKHKWELHCWVIHYRIIPIIQNKDCTHNHSHKVPYYSKPWE